MKIERSLLETHEMMVDLAARPDGHPLTLTARKHSSVSQADNTARVDVGHYVSHETLLPIVCPFGTWPCP